mgnify:CR=1 FL=1
MPHKGSNQIFFNEINGLEQIREKLSGNFPLQMKHLERPPKVTREEDLN